MPYKTVEMSAWAKIADQTKIEYLAGSDHVEFTLGGGEGLMLVATERAFANLVEAGISALRELHDKQVS